MIYLALMTQSDRTFALIMFFVLLIAFVAYLVSAFRRAMKRVDDDEQPTNRATVIVSRPEIEQAHRTFHDTSFGPAVVEVHTQHTQFLDDEETK